MSRNKAARRASRICSRGQVSLTCDSLSGVALHTDKRSSARVLGAARSPLLPEVPTVAESLPGYELTNWFGL